MHVELNTCNIVGHFVKLFFFLNNVRAYLESCEIAASGLTFLIFILSIQRSSFAKHNLPFKTHHCHKCFCKNLTHHRHSNIQKVSLAHLSL